MIMSTLYKWKWKQLTKWKMGENNGTVATNN